MVNERQETQSNDDCKVVTLTGGQALVRPKKGLFGWMFLLIQCDAGSYTHVCHILLSEIPAKFSKKIF
ncbi:hypothetical protein B9Z55_002075 [Caenorhabditis nigoni]|uniref:Uncharacterized protein n=1 Tax=Caenorhabditis nigoni TaxID=1611254 RepID=A0A2G5VJ50_9PELO|nr:hypothetical protein B9Z55_002075 [Caenorhabditis nigoni]